MAKYLDKDEAVDRLIDETPEGVPLRDDADPCRLSDQQRSDRWKKRRRDALLWIVRACADGAWKATGKKPGSAEREHIPDITFIDSEINVCGDLMATPGPVPFRLSRRPGPNVVLWTELRFSVPDSADDGNAAAGAEGVPVEPPTPAQDEEKPLGNDQSQLSRRDQEKAKTKAKYERWYQTALEIKRERGDNKPLRPIKICETIADRERKAGHTKANAETIKRRLNKDHRGWAD